MLDRKKVKLKIIAKQFGISHTQLNRIKNGENWADVKAD
jgi:DNA-binding Xre family transcriptional regulator